MPENLSVEIEDPRSTQATEEAERDSENTEEGQEQGEAQQDDPNQETVDTPVEEESGDQEESEDDAADDAESESGDDDDEKSLFAKTQEKFLQDGQLEDDDYKALEEKYDVSRAEVDEYISARQAAADAVNEAGKAIVGGDEAYASMAQWATNNLSTEEREAFNAEVQSGNTKRALDAIRGLNDKFQKASGSDPKLKQGARKKAPGPKPFASQSEVVRAMQDPRYKTDASYRAKVRKRLAVSS